MLRILRLNVNYRYYSIKHATNEPVKYTNTINLPKTKFPNRLTASKRQEIERNLIEGTFANAYRYQEQHNKEPTFILHDGPPYANGDLHMGHAVNKILKDITLRHRVAKGQKVHYIPGWDCHGLPIELKALSSTSAESKNVDPLTIRKKSRKFALDAISKQKEEFRSWGVLSDWNDSNNIYLTFNPSFIINQLQMFLDFYERGLVYRDLKPVYWSPSSRTALAEAELEYDPNFVSPSVYIRFLLNKTPDALSIPNKETVYALVWTTTPWTLPSNQAICYNENLNYSLVRLCKEAGSASNELYILATNLIPQFELATQLKCEILQSFKGDELQHCEYTHPINRNVSRAPFFAAAHVQDTKGTGLVHTAPAHGPEDFLVSLTQKIPVISYVNEHGIYTDDAPEFLRGKEVLTDGDSLVLRHVANDIIFSGKLVHAYPIDWRTKKPVIIRASKQWFINTDRLKERAVEEINNVEIYPRVNSAASKAGLVAQVKKRPYWCISRQRAWGVPIPVFVHKDTGEVVTNKKIISHICNLIEKEGNIDFWWLKSVDDLLPKELLDELKLSPASLTKGADIFDIWFDSGSSWSSVLGKERIADLYLEGTDQLTGWFQSSLLTSVASRNSSPYKSLFVHGFTVDKNGLKMSKSLGNVISPKDITNKFGMDVLRWWVASHGTQNMSITVSDSLLEQSAENISKIRSTLRYLNGAVQEKSKDLHLQLENQMMLSKYMLSALKDFDTDILNHYNSYEYNRVVANIQNFIVNKISGVYVNTIKDRLYCGTSSEIEDMRFVLVKCYEVLCKAIWPIAPFLIEESWSHYDKDNAFHKSIVLTDSTWNNNEVEKIIHRALHVKRIINQKVQKVNTWTLDVTVTVKNENDLNMLSSLQPQLNSPISNSELCELLQVGRITLALDKNINDEFVTNIETLNGVLCPRCRRFSVEDVDCICERCKNVLENSKHLF